MAGDVESNKTLANLDEAVKRGMELHRGTEGGEPGKQKKVLHRAGVTSDQYDDDDVVRKGVTGGFAQEHERRLGCRAARPGVFKGSLTTGNAPIPAASLF